MTKCVDGTFGDNCGSKCGHCINGSTTCHHIDGSCRSGCSPGYKVDTCIEVCDPGKYGSQCSSICGRCSNGAPCHHINGTCLTGCAAGKQGNTCDTDCTPGMYGPNCENTCGDCKGGPRTCNITDGSCPGGCAAGWQGTLCETACEEGRYGVKCAEQCGKCRDGQTCNRFNGTCENGCSPGWKESDCKQNCSFGWYGDACREECGSCAGGKNCDHVDGRCPKDGQTYRCDPGLKGETCKIVCSSTEYGPDCRQVCGQCSNSSCESVSGNCTEGCTEGWSGVLCTEKLNPPDPPFAPPGGLVGGIAGTVVAIIFLVIVVVVVINRRNQKPLSTPEQPTSDRENGVLYENMAANTHVTDTANNTDHMMYENVGNISRNDEHQSGLLTENLLQEIIRKEECNEFEMDFKGFLTGNQFPCEEATKANNKSRNRYKTTFPYDHSRVQLDGDQSYINANFIKDLDGTNAYVATQGPKMNTLGDFWKMVWQLKTGKIVMLAKCVELGKPKVEKYWPDAGSSISHDGMKISFISSKEYAAYTVRKLKLENENTQKTRVISQFHLLKWPDHGTPDVMHFALLLLHMDSVNSKLSGPIVVHCSAGVGRTGTFIASDVLFRHGKSTGRVDPPAYVQSMRQDRMDMVQTKPQYVFIYHALVELFLIDNTKLTAGDFDSNCLKSSRLLQEYKVSDILFVLVENITSF
ncbi:receptor-type tyrosine-protein phosphatase S-like [Mizuhopecten yessoensis]|uniref:receptor-type tyrosine-protein phosphatase S-like n=1 Tax=Mizuhopecten yessoensis TaxID=6573 RepID=UPI000B45C7E9|nr:receptor-type tyrosine-protein phosphatase S-like [Mizuhopecten yessoensis]